MAGVHLDLHPSGRAVGDTRLFASARDEQRLRRPLDAVTAACAGALLALLAWWAQPTLGFERSLVEAVTSSTNTVAVAAETRHWSSSGQRWRTIVAITAATASSATTS